MASNRSGSNSTRTGTAGRTIGGQMDKSLKHVGVLGMRWGHRKSGSEQPVKMYGNRALTKQENRDEIALRQTVIAKSKNPHIERREADRIFDNAQRESGKNLDKALDRFAGENDLKHAVKKGYIAPPNKNIEEMSSQEIQDHLNSHPSIREHLQKDYEKSIKRGQIIASTLMVGFVAAKVASIVIDQKVYNDSVNAMASGIMDVLHK